MTEFPPSPLRGPLTKRRFRFLDLLIAVLTLFALSMLMGFGGSIAVLLAVSIIGLPLAFVMWLSVPAIAFLIPMRLSYILLRTQLRFVPATLLALLVGAIAFTAIDITLKSGPKAAQARAFVADDTPVVPITLNAGSSIALDFGPETASGACTAMCERLLRDPLISEVVMILRTDQDGTRHGIRYTPLAATCPAPTNAGQTQRRSGTHCLLFDADVTATVSLTERRLPAPDRNFEARSLTLRHGAASQTFHLAYSQIATGGGLLSPNSTGVIGETLVYQPRIRTRIFAGFPLTETRSWDTARRVLIGQALGL